MKTIEQITGELQQNFDIKLVGKIQSWGGGKKGDETDIDFFIRPKQTLQIAKFLIENNFIVNYKSVGSGVYGKKSINGEVFHLDMLESLLPLRRFPGVTFNSKYYEDSWVDRDLEKFFRYFIFFRGHDKKYVDFIKKQWNIYGKFLSDTTYTTMPLCKKDLLIDDVIGVMKKKPYKFIKIFKLSQLFLFTKAYLRYFFQKIFWNKEGEIIAFVGPDGSGKTTVLNTVQATFARKGPHTVYMGDAQYKMQNFYTWLLAKGAPLAYLVYFLAYIENWGRYLSIWLRKIRGEVVLTDRWPNYNSFHANKKRRTLENVLYSIFPDPDRFVFLSGDPEIIHTRKPERTIKEIEIYQAGIRQKLKNKNYTIIATDKSFDSTINTVFRFMVYGGRIDTRLPDEIVKVELAKAISK